MLKKVLAILLLCCPLWATSYTTLTLAGGTQSCTTTPYNPPPQSGTSDLRGYWSGGTNPVCNYQNDLYSHASKYGIYLVSCGYDPSNDYPIADDTYNDTSCQCDKDYENHILVTVAQNCAQVQGVTYWVYVWFDNCPW